MWGLIRPLWAGRNDISSYELIFTLRCAVCLLLSNFKYILNGSSNNNRIHKILTMNFVFFYMYGYWRVFAREENLSLFLVTSSVMGFRLQSEQAQSTPHNIATVNVTSLTNGMEGKCLERIR